MDLRASRWTLGGGTAGSQGGVAAETPGGGGGGGGGLHLEGRTITGQEIKGRNGQMEDTQLSGRESEKLGGGSVGE